MTYDDFDDFDAEPAGHPNPQYDPFADGYEVYTQAPPELLLLHAELSPWAARMGIRKWALYAGMDFGPERQHEVALYINGTANHPVVLVDPEYPEEELRLSVLHELGHAYIDGALTDEERDDLDDEEELVEGFARRVESWGFEDALQTLKDTVDSVVEVFDGEEDDV
jgi:hypothetical protein